MDNSGLDKIKSGILIILLLLSISWAQDSSKVGIDNVFNRIQSDSAYIIFNPDNWNRVQSVFVPVQKTETGNRILKSQNPIVSTDPNYDLFELGIGNP
ncbi:MAG: hypothetical protein V3S48_07375, partial [Candidatus Neomarinimicrobiota bacterium]